MKTFFSKIWKSITKDTGLSSRLFLILLVVAILIIAMLLSGPKPKEYTPISTSTPIPVGITPSIIVPTRAPSPEYVQATGVIVAVVTIVLIVIIGTIVEIIRDKDKNEEIDKNRT